MVSFKNRLNNKRKQAPLLVLSKTTLSLKIIFDLELFARRGLHCRSIALDLLYMRRLFPKLPKETKIYRYYFRHFSGCPP